DRQAAVAWHEYNPNDLHIRLFSNGGDLKVKSLSAWDMKPIFNNAVAITTPTLRQVIQRDSENIADIPVNGSYNDSPDSIEARAVAPQNKDIGAIWFIGDSITQSNADGDANGSPRKSLYDLLIADGYTFSFTGHYTANVDGLPTTGGTAATNLFHYHSGIGGSCIGANSNGRTDMTASIAGWWTSTSGRLASTKPNIVLIMLGTNDIDLNDAVATAPDRIKTLVDTILAQVGPGDPTPAIYVAQIPPNRYPGAGGERVVDFNNALPAIITTLQGEGKDVTLVDLWTAINADKTGLMRDSLHTNAAGNDVLATQWFNAIDSRFDVPSSGATTAWQTIDAAPTGGTFSGTLSDVSAGGWYNVEVRSVTSGTPSDSVSVAKVGVGDVYIIAGQSNSANWGSPAAAATDDRVAARSELTGNTWETAADPMPIANGTGGSPWPRFGDLYVASENVPVGIMSVGVGGTTTIQWQPGGSLYPRIKSAVESFPANGFKAILWHQGESDTVASVTAAQHQTNLENIISESRSDAGWSVPWYLSEVSFMPSTSLAQEMPIAAGQRATAYADPLTLLGARTDDFHLESKTSDGTHYNAAGLLDHATQWHTILTGNPDFSILNADLESNTALADGGIVVISTAATNSPSVIGYQVLASSGTAVADCDSGYFNPNTTFYSGADDSVDGGVAPNMSGKHVAFLYGGSAGNYYLQPIRTRLEPNNVYNLTVAIGRRISGTFGGATIEILANGTPIATTTVTVGDVTADSFTDFSTIFTAPDNQGVGQELAIRITKVGGSATYLDFDNVRLTDNLTAFGTWQETNYGSTSDSLAKKDLDSESDNLTNFMEFFLGTSPDTIDHLPVPIDTGSAGQFQMALNPAATDPGLDLEYSLNLSDWYSVTSPGPGHTGIQSTRTSTLWTAEVPFTLGDRAFYRLKTN
ncbi:MAG: sialate O-acetylesterase, partial [Akkermansiaceae bacterium]|nr:sialate O-acetylesterase [Akkermansiaceae bacterium]